MKPKYSEAFIEQAVVTLPSRGDRSVQAVANDLNVNYHTAKYWIKRALLNKAVLSMLSLEEPKRQCFKRITWMLRIMMNTP